MLFYDEMTVSGLVTSRMDLRGKVTEWILRIFLEAGSYSSKHQFFISPIAQLRRDLFFSDRGPSAAAAAIT